MSRRPGDDVPELGPADELSQFGRKGSGFRRAPRPDLPELGVSVVLGRLPVDEVARVVAKRPAVRDDGARYTYVGRLQEAGFTVKRTPTHANPRHVSVLYRGRWDEEVAERFDGAFGEPIYKEDDG